MGRTCHPDCRCLMRRSTKQSTPCRAVNCAGSCSPAYVRASRIVVGGPRTANGGAGSATSSANGRRRWRGPGNLEGDLIKGNRSSGGTLVERTSRKLVKLADAKAETARDGFAAGFLAVPAPLRLTLTYDQGKEMARHRELAALTGLRVYFADPHAPWQRGSNENTNGLLRQYLPKGTDLSLFSQAELDAIATRRNSRPRKTLGFAKRDEVFSALVDKTANAVTSRNAEGVRYGT